MTSGLSCIVMIKMRIHEDPGDLKEGSKGSLKGLAEPLVCPRDLVAQDQSCNSRDYRDYGGLPILFRECQKPYINGKDFYNV